MSIETKKGWTICRLIATNALKDTTAVVQRMGRYVSCGIAPGNHLAVHPYPFALVKRHRISSIKVRILCPICFSLSLSPRSLPTTKRQAKAYRTCISDLDLDG